MVYKIVMSILIIAVFSIAAGTIGVLLGKLFGVGKPYFMGGACGAATVTAVVVINYAFFKKK